MPQNNDALENCACQQKQEQEQEQAGQPRIDISACLEAHGLYDAAYHRDRGGAVLPPPKPQVVSFWGYLRAVGTKVGALALGCGLLLIMLITGARIVTNGVQDVSDYQKAQPIIHIGSPPVRVKHWVQGEWQTGYDYRVRHWVDGGWQAGYDYNGKVVNGEFVVDADGPGTWSEVSAYKLPVGWAKTNAAHYASLLIILLSSCIAARICLRGSRRIRTGVPIQYADTAHLSAQESLVRASQEPAGASLVRGASRPDASPDTLLRPLGSTHETPSEQLVRAVAGQEQG